jgi:hypothetical protein
MNFVRFPNWLNATPDIGKNYLTESRNKCLSGCCRRPKSEPYMRGLLIASWFRCAQPTLLSF